MAANPTFSDNFSSLSLWNGTSGTWNTNYWYNTLTGNGGSLSSNGEQEWYINSNDPATSSVKPWSVQNGILTITGSAAPSSIQPLINNYQYMSGELNTYHSFSQTYGFFEMRGELPAGQGLWPAFWMIPENGSWPPEIDAMEVLGNSPTTLYTSMHSGTASNEVNAGGIETVADTSKAYHEYAVDWTPTTITWYFDNKAVYSQPTPSDMNVPMYMEVNLAMGGAWPGDISSTTPLPAQMRVANVQAYASNPNPIAASTTFTADNTAGQLIIGAPGNDVFNAGTNSVIMTGDGLTNTYVYNALPTAAGQITDFDPGTDTINLTGLLQSVGYTGSNPISDGTITAVSDGNGGSNVLYNHNGASTVIVELDNVAPSQVLNTDFIYSGGTSSSGSGTGSGTSINDPAANGTAGQVLTATAPNATFQAGQNSVVMTEDGGSNTFVYTAVPFNTGQITNFNPTSDTIDISAMLKSVGYAGSNPFGDGTLTLASDGHGGTELTYNPPGAGSNGIWPSQVVDIDNVAPGSLNTGTDFITGYGSSSSGSAAPSSAPAASAGEASGSSSGSEHIYGWYSDGAPVTSPIIGWDSSGNPITAASSAEASGEHIYGWYSDGAPVTSPIIGWDSSGNPITAASSAEASGEHIYGWYSDGAPVTSPIIGWDSSGNPITAASSAEASGEHIYGWYSDGAPVTSPIIGWDSSGNPITAASSAEASGEQIYGWYSNGAPVTSPIIGWDSSGNPITAASGSGTAVGATLTGDNTAGQVLTATTPNDIFVGGQNSVVMTGDGGSNSFVFNSAPWNAGQITNFNPASDNINVAGLLHSEGYAGTNPFGDGTLSLTSDGNGGTNLMYSPPGAGSNGVWPIKIVDIDHVASTAINTSKDFILH